MAKETTEASVAKSDEMEAALQNAKLEIQTLKEDFAIYRHAYRTKLRKDSPKVIFPEMKISEELTLNNFRIRSIENGEICYLSNDGFGRIPLSNAPQDIVDFLHLAEEAKDRAIFPEIASRRVSDFDMKAETTFLVKEAESTASNLQTERQRMRDAKIHLKTAYEKREKELMQMSRDLDKVRISLTTKRNRHREYNEYYKTNIRDRAIGNLSKSIAKIDKRSRVIYEKVDEIRDLMRKYR